MDNTNFKSAIAATYKNTNYYFILSVVLLVMILALGIRQRVVTNNLNKEIARQEGFYDKCIADNADFITLKKSNIELKALKGDRDQIDKLIDKHSTIKNKAANNILMGNGILINLEGTSVVTE